MLAWASGALNKWNERQYDNHSGIPDCPSGASGGSNPKKRTASYDDDGAKRLRNTAGEVHPVDSEAARAPVPAPPKKKLSVLRTVEDLEQWLSDVSEEVDANLLQQSTRNIIQLLRDSRTAPSPATFPHSGGNPLRPAMAFEEVLLQEGTTHVGKLAMNLYCNKHCGELARQLLGECIGGNQRQLEQIDKHVSALCREKLDKPLVNIVCQAIQTLQQRARIARTHVEVMKMRQSVESSRDRLNQSGDDSTPMELSKRIDDFINILDEQKQEFLPKLIEASSCFLLDGSQFNELVEQTTQTMCSLTDRKEVGNAALAQAKQALKNARASRRQLLLSADDEEDSSPRGAETEQSTEFLNRMKLAEETRVEQSEYFERQISQAISAMEGLHTEQKDLEGKEVAAAQLQAFVQSVKDVYVECTIEQHELAKTEMRGLIALYGEDSKDLCTRLDEHLIFHCKRIHHFNARLGPKKQELEHLLSLCLDQGEASINRSNLENEVNECKQLVAQSVDRVSLCKSKVREHVSHYVSLLNECTGESKDKMADSDASFESTMSDEDDQCLAALTVQPPEFITGAHSGSFMAMSCTDNERVRVTVDPYGLTLHKHTSIVAFYDYRSIRSWDMSDEHFGVIPSKRAAETGQSTRAFKLNTTEGRAIARMMNANATLLVEQTAQENESAEFSTVKALKKSLLNSHETIVTFCTLIHGYSKAKLAYRGDLVEGLPHGTGKLVFSASEWYEGEFSNGQPMGRGRFKKANGWIYEGEFVGTRPVGGSYIYKAMKKVDGEITEQYEGQLRHDFVFHGSGRLRSCDAVAGMVVHFEGSFADGTPHSVYARLWMYPGNPETAHRRGTMESKVAIFLGAVDKGLPATTGELVLPALRNAGGARTTYRGTFDGTEYMDFGKPAGSGSIAYTNGNVYTGPIMEADGSSFMPVPMSGELIVTTSHGIATECIYHGEFDHLGRPQGEGKLERASDGRVIHEGKFEDGEPSAGWGKWLFG